MSKKKLKRVTEGYQPIRKGYQPTKPPKNPKPPKGGTGLGSRYSDKKESNQKKNED